MKDCSGMGINYYSSPCSDKGQKFIVDNMLPGSTYYIQFYLNAGQNFNWSIIEQEPIPGEQCLNPASAIIGKNIIPQNYTGNEMYYEYQATQNGLAIINTCGNILPNGEMYIDVMENCNTYYNNTNESSCENGRIVSFETTIGQKYIIRISNTQQSSGTELSWSLVEQELLQGESCSLPIIAKEGMNMAFPYGNRNVSSTYYTYTAQATGLVKISNCDLSTLNTQVYITSNDCKSKNILAYNDDKCNTQSELSFEVLSGETYNIIWESSNINSFNWTLAFTEGGTLSPGQSCANPFILTSGANALTANSSLMWMKYENTSTGGEIVSLAIDITPEMMPFIGESELYVVQNCNLAFQDL